MRARLATATRSLRAADQPSETWSSCIALVGSVSVLAGTASRRFSATIAACVYWPIMSPEFTPASGARNGGRPRDRPWSSSRSVRRSLSAPRSAIEMARKSATAATGAPWKLPHDSTRPSGSTTGLSMNETSFACGDRAGVLDGVTRCAVDLRRAAQRVGVLDPIVAVAMAGDDRRTGEQRPEVRRAGRLADLRAHADEVGGERPVGAEQRLRRHRPGDVGDAQQHIEVGEGQDEHAEHPVGAVDERQALLGPQRERFDAGGREGGGAVDERAVRQARLALSEQDQGTRRQGGQVPAGAE